MDSEKPNNRRVLKSSDGIDFAIDEAAARQSPVVKGAIEDGIEDPIPVPNVEASTLAKFVECWNGHAALGPEPSKLELEQVKKWEAEWVNGLDKKELLEVLMAANFLECQQLLDLACQKVADTIKGMTVEEVRDYFGIVNDFTSEEEAKIREENKWAFM